MYSHVKDGNKLAYLFIYDLCEVCEYRAALR